MSHAVRQIPHSPQESGLQTPVSHFLWIVTQIMAQNHLAIGIKISVSAWTQPMHKESRVRCPAILFYVRGPSSRALARRSRAGQNQRPGHKTLAFGGQHGQNQRPGHKTLAFGGRHGQNQRPGHKTPAFCGRHGQNQRPGHKTLAFCGRQGQNQRPGYVHAETLTTNFILI